MKEKMKQIWLKIRQYVLIFFIVIVLRIFVFEITLINWHSMEKSFHHWEFVYVNKLGYSLFIKDFNRGDVVVINSNDGIKNISYLKRIIGLPEETIKIEEWIVYIKEKNSQVFKKLEEDYLSPENYWKTFMDIEKGWAITIEIPKGEYFVMGDNRMNSSDSRNCFWNCYYKEATHFVKREQLEGKLLFSFGWFNFKEFKMEVNARGFNIPNEYNYINF